MRRQSPRRTDEAGRKARSGWACRKRKTFLVAVDQLESLLSPYRTYDVTGPQQVRAVIARQARSRLSIRAIQSAAEKTRGRTPS